ncbi:hypothetical protein [Amycolatopsis sp. NPDC051716]|uniref:hypothetical protein n=1 Tax=Amycolatopsis sp. NPDC051716 TaxID=3155804 RepID=UPI003424921C
MGGLVARSAIYRAQEQNLAGLPRVTRLVCLGTPHSGAPLERRVAQLASLLRNRRRLPWPDCSRCAATASKTSPTDTLIYNPTLKLPPTCSCCDRRSSEPADGTGPVWNSRPVHRHRHVRHRSPGGCPAHHMNARSSERSAARASVPPLGWHVLERRARGRLPVSGGHLHQSQRLFAQPEHRADRARHPARVAGEGLFQLEEQQTIRLVELLLRDPDRAAFRVVGGPRVVPHRQHAAEVDRDLLAGRAGLRGVARPVAAAHLQLLERNRSRDGHGTPSTRQERATAPPEGARGAAQWREVTIDVLEQVIGRRGPTASPVLARPWVPA